MAWFRRGPKEYCPKFETNSQDKRVQSVAVEALLPHLWRSGESVGSQLRKYFMLTLGWFLTILGIVLTPMPIPIPLIGILPFMAGLALLIHYSRNMRRFIQRVRHRVRWLSYMLEHFAHRAPKKIARILHRSHPAPIERHARIQGRPTSEIESKN